VQLSELKGKKCYTCWGLGTLCAGCPVVLAIKTGQSQSAVLTPYNQSHWPADQGSWLVKAAPVRDRDGKIIGAIEIAEDVTKRMRAEESLRESEERERRRAAELAALLDAVPMPVFIAHDPDCNHITGNRAADELLRNPRGSEASLSAPPETKPRHFRAMKDGRELRFDELPAQRAARGEQVQDFEFTLSFDNGSVRHVLGYGTPLLDDQERPRGAALVLADITERKRAEQALRESEERYRLIFETANEGIWVTDGERRTILVNQRMADMLGYTTDELQGRIPSEFLDAGQEPVVLKARQDLTGGATTHYEFRFRRKDGSDLWAISSAAPIRDQEALSDSEARFRLMFDQSPVGSIIIDRKFQTMRVNRALCRFLGYSAEEMNIKTLADYTHPDDLGREMEVGGVSLERGTGFALDKRYIRKDGQVVWGHLAVDAVRNQTGQALYYIGLVQDITGRKRAEAALRESNATLEQKVQERTAELAARAAQLRALASELTLAEQRERSRLANILHDHLQQMLVAAKFRLTVLGRGGDDVLKQATKEVEEMIDESIVASRSLTAELSPPVLHEAGLNEGLQWLARRMADTQGLFVDLELNESGALPEDLKILLFQSVRELLFNVVKHANTRSAVVNLRCFDGLLQVTVSDQGSGFDPAALPLAGEGGRGFGLLGIQERLKYMGGTLEIKSNPGQGSRCVLSVPVVAPAANELKLHELPVLPEAYLRAAPNHPDPARKIRVMLADDHAIVRQGIANLLANEPDMEVVGQAADGQEAIELAARLLPDVILMDVSMSKLNGVEATRAIRNECPEIRIIGLSMFEDIERARAMRDAGAVDYVTKSGPADVLINLIRTSIQAEKKALSAKT
jgi:PAS domain S-box-containing protein